MDQDRSRGVRADPAVLHALSFGEPAVTRDALFARLDGQLIRGRERAWRTEVVSIVAERDVTWVQVVPADDPSTSVVLRLRDDKRPELALAALREWLDLPDDRRTTWIEVGLRG
jgi:hypothetical protein